MFNKRVLLSICGLFGVQNKFNQLQMPVIVKDKTLKSKNGSKRTNAAAFKRAAAKNRNVAKRKSNRK